MMSSNLRGEISGLSKIKALYAVYVLVIDASRNLNGQLNGILIVPVDVIMEKVTKHIEMFTDGLLAGKGSSEIFEAGKRYNTGRLN